MVCPIPISLFCAIILCLPLAITFLTLQTPVTVTSGGATKFAATTDHFRTAVDKSDPFGVGNILIRGKGRDNPPQSLPNTAAVPQKYGSLSQITPPPFPENKASHRVAERVNSEPGSQAEAIREIDESSKTTLKKNENDPSHLQLSGQPTIPNTTTTSLPPPPPPLSAALDSEDKSLLQNAAKTSRKPKHPKKVAFMFLTTTPLPFSPLWELFFNQTNPNLYNIYVHADPTFTYDPPFSGVFAGRVVKSKPTQRFTPTLVSAARRLLAHALLHDASNSMFTLLSSACIPLHSFNFTYKTLAPSTRSFIEILKNESGAYGRWAARGVDVMLPEVPLSKFRIGSQFFALTRRHAKIVVSDRRLWRKFMLPCVKWDTCYPEENYFATLMSMKDPRGCVPATLTYVNWTDRHDGHPRTYVASEVGPELIMEFRNHTPRYGDFGINGSDLSVMKRNDPFLFARKFPPDALQLLVKIANGVIFKD